MGYDSFGFAWRQIKFVLPILLCKITEAQSNWMGGIREKFFGFSNKLSIV